MERQDQEDNNSDGDLDTPMAVGLAALGREPSPSHQRTFPRSLGSSRSEAERYLDSPPMRNTKEIKSDPLKAWRLLQHEYPTLAKMASDILAIPASEVGVERLFNIGRDVCHYRRNRLEGKTIEDIMMVKLWKRIQGDILLPQGWSPSEVISMEDENHEIEQVNSESPQGSDLEELGEDQPFYLDEANKMYQTRIA